MVELLAPAGSLQSLRAAVNAGADAVYIGGSMFGARAYADNPDEHALIEGIEFCHLHGRRLYMTVNTLLKEKEIEHRLYDYLLPYYKSGVDGLIVQDLGVVQFVQEYFPGLEVHASTQMTVTGAEGARLLQKRGITRVVPARELSLEEIRRIIDETGIEVETFIHGAMCYSYSGQCLLSSMIGGRSGNRGRCAQPCRLPYTLVEKGRFDIRTENNYRKRSVNSKEPDRHGGCNFNREKSDRNSSSFAENVKRNGNDYLLSMKDLCTLELLPDLIDCGVASMKIEGRMKRPEYTAGVVSVYRRYIDLYLKSGRRKYRVKEEDRRMLMDLYNRGGFSKGYYFMHNGPEMMSMERPNHFGTEAVRIKQVMKGRIKGVALEPLHKKDVLELSAGNEITVAQDAAKGDTVTLTVGNTPVHPGTVLNRTKNEYLLQCLESQFLKENVKEKIKGDLRIFASRPAILKLNCRDFCVEVSDVIAELAQNNPTPCESIEKQMKKTGNTPFVFESLHVELEDGLFVSVRQLNELRRNGIEQLKETILDAARRVEPTRTGKDDTEDLSGGCEHDPGNELRLNILVTDQEQLRSVMECTPKMADIVYLDSMLWPDEAGTRDGKSDLDRTKEQSDSPGDSRLADAAAVLHEKGIRCFLNFPPIFRKKERMLLEKLEKSGILDDMDGFLLHTIDELAWAKEYEDRIRPAKGDCGKILAADDTFYTYNRRAADFLKEQGICQITLPAELNFKELSMLDTCGAELNVYGYQALMHSAQCVTRNTKGCTKRPAILYLRDRKRAEFPVLNRCNVCCNTIYNSVPLQLGDCKAEMEKLRIGSVRLTFTIESGEETRRILRQYESLLLGEGTLEETDLEGTRGHFRRGVE